MSKPVILGAPRRAVEPNPVISDRDLRSNKGEVQEPGPKFELSVSNALKVAGLIGAGLVGRTLFNKVGDYDGGIGGAVTRSTDDAARAVRAAQDELGHVIRNGSSPSRTGAYFEARFSDIDEPLYQSALGRVDAVLTRSFGFDQRQRDLMHRFSTENDRYRIPVEIPTAPIDRSGEGPHKLVADYIEGPTVFETPDQRAAKEALTAEGVVSSIKSDHDLELISADIDIVIANRIEIIRGTISDEIQTLESRLDYLNMMGIAHMHPEVRDLKPRLKMLKEFLGQVSDPNPNRLDAIIASRRTIHQNARAEYLGNIESNYLVLGSRISDYQNMLRDFNRDHLPEDLIAEMDGLVSREVDLENWRDIAKFLEDFRGLHDIANRFYANASDDGKLAILNFVNRRDSFFSSDEAVTGLMNTIRADESRISRIDRNLEQIGVLERTAELRAVLKERMDGPAGEIMP